MDAPSLFHVALAPDSSSPNLKSESTSVVDWKSIPVTASKYLKDSATKVALDALKPVASKLFADVL